MKIATFNANGIRAALRKDFLPWFAEKNIDVLGIQETKIQESQIKKEEFDALGYHNNWHSAVKKGYSGVGFLSKIKPNNVVVGMGEEVYDSEGRVIKAEYDDFSVIDVYIPSGTSGEDRHQFKMRFLESFLKYLNEEVKKQKNLIVMGDFNIVHKELDIHNPERKDNPSGYRPDERQWLSDWLDSGFYDSFRLIYPEKKQFSWWSYRAASRQRNKGWRIDYICVSEALKDKVKDVQFYSDIVFSDHCPVVLDIDL